MIISGCKKKDDNNPDNTPPLNRGAIIDVDGNGYDTIRIGTQVWMVQNLKTTKYNDGTLIPLVTNDSTWANLATPGYCWYNNDAAAYKNTYGALYNWYTVNTGKLAPKGWHVPTDAEWTTLTTYLGGDTIAGGKLKETGMTHWEIPNTGATNVTGFTALPGGYRSSSGVFDYIVVGGYWWSSTECNSSSAWYRLVYFNSSSVFRYNYFTKEDGFSIRCIKD